MERDADIQASTIILSVILRLAGCGIMSLFGLGGVAMQGWRLSRSSAVLAMAVVTMTVPAWAFGKPAATSAVNSRGLPQDVVLRHMLSGVPQDTLATLVLRFNDEQKGRGRVILQNVHDLDDQERHNLPTMALLEPDDGPLFFHGLPRFKPMHQVMAVAAEKLDAKQFFPLIADAVDDGAGRIQALPLGLSLPVLLWNKKVLRQAGLDPDESPKTWLEVQARAGSLFDAGSKCPVTTSRFSWVHLENVSTQHGEPLAVAEKGGRSQVRLNSMVDVKHLALLSSWYKAHYFRYFGPGNEADRRFLAGECAMMTGESALYPEAVRAGLDVGISQMPFYDDMYGANQEKILPGGQGLWVLAGRKKEEYLTAAHFARFMLRPDVQSEWLRGTGFLPMTPGALNAMKARGAPQPLVTLASRRLAQASPAKTRAKYNFGLTRLREILGEEVATVWANLKPAKEALDTAMRRANSAPLYSDQAAALQHD
jgi:sn-glycerol 3-phosphate transport system substrate-binding protein